MFLLIPSGTFVYLIEFISLHSTMFLLIRLPSPLSRLENSTLHSTMFLLIREEAVKKILWFYTFTFHYVSINTGVAGLQRVLNNSFTFHYVSINTSQDKGFPKFISTLHSTMFLLILISAAIRVTECSLYIPLCFY